MTSRSLQTVLTALLLVLAPAPAAPAQESAPPQAQAPPVPQPQAPAQPEAASAPPPSEAQPAQTAEAAQTPVRLSMTDGDVSFWRPGAEDWTQARINTPLAPGDALYAAPGATQELQIGPSALVRTSGDTEIEIENSEPDFLQLKTTGGHMSLDLRRLKAGQTVEIDTPNAAFRTGTSGYYRLDVANDTTTFITRRGGRATLAPAQGEALGIASSEEVVVQGSDNPRVETYVAPELDAWDRWNYARTDHLIDAVSSRYVSSGVYGVDELDHYGTWRETPDYGPVWVPTAVASGWAPYSAGRWLWDPLYGWSWVDDAPWGWAPCHYGRWIHASGYWGWAPGPLIVAPVYAPALVAFVGGPHFGVSIGLGAPAVGWVALGWGEPVVPWWGRPGFIGVPWWGGWGGPRVVNNVVINRTTIVNSNTINIYQNASVHNAVIATREDQFGRGVGAHVRVAQLDPHQFEPLHGKLPVQPATASLSPSLARAPRPPDAMRSRSVVATRPPHDAAASLHAAGLTSPAKPAPAPRLVSAPQGLHPAFAAPRPAFGQSSSERRPPPPPPQFERNHAAQSRQLAPSSAPAEPAHVPNTHAALPQHGERADVHAPAAPGAVNAPAPNTQRAPAHGSAPPAPPAAPAFERHAASPRQMPGQPANRLYQSQPAAPPPHANAAPPPIPRHGAAPPMRQSAPQHHNQHHG